MNLFTAAQMKEIDRVAIEDRGIPSLELMEHAAMGLVETMEYMLEEECDLRPEARGEVIVGKHSSPFIRSGKGPKQAAVFAGPGNNGGDGVAAARLLAERGWKVFVFLVGERTKLTPDTAAMAERLSKAGLELKEFPKDDEGLCTLYARCAQCDVFVDALFGVGLCREVTGDFAAAISLMNSFSQIPTVSADIPSGIHADTGEMLGCAVKADVTVTFSAGKPGLYMGKGAIHAGRVVVADIGIPWDLMKEGCDVTVMERPILPRRPRDAHKGDFGKVLILAGSRGYTGAPCLAARAAVRGGAGLVTVAVPEDVYPIVAAKCCDEAMVWPLPDSYEALLEKAKTAHVLLIGPGLGQSPEAEERVLGLLRDTTCPIILDADGLNILSRHIDVLDKREALTILTPHDGEFARLFGCELPLRDRLTAAREFAAAHRCVLVLKGHHTITADWQGKTLVNTTGNPGMARGGSGDALAGLMAALLGQKKDLSAVAEAVWLHGRAGDLAAAEKGEYGMTVTDLIEQLPYAMKECEEE